MPEKHCRSDPPGHVREVVLDLHLVHPRVGWVVAVPQPQVRGAYFEAQDLELALLQELQGRYIWV